MKETEMKTNTIGEIVAQDYRTAAVFKEAGIDFCCGGKKTIAAACNEKGIDEEDLLGRLEEVRATSIDNNHNFNEWDPGFLCDYIINVHHSYVRRNLPELLAYTEKIARVHGDRHPELYEVADLFSAVNDELLPHLDKEEKILFPAIKDMLKTGSERSAGIVKSEISGLSGEHESAGDAMDRIKELTQNYKVPADACNTYRVSLGLLEEFENDLHTHVHLENNIVFPKAINEAN